MLRDGGRYLLVIWDSVERNLATMPRAGRSPSCFRARPRASMSACRSAIMTSAQIERDLLAAGFTDIEFETVELRSRAASARDAAIALVQGTPMRADIEQIDPDVLDRATDAAERRCVNSKDRTDSTRRCRRTW